MKLKFVGKKKEEEHVYSFIFEPSNKVSWQPGQYLHYELPHPDTDDRGIERWFTISAPPYEKNIMLTTRFDSQRSSTFKKALHKLKPGQEVEAGEPRGDFLLEPDASRHVLIAGGIGVTPYRSMLLQLDHDGNKFIGNQRITEDDIRPYLEDEGDVFYVSGPRPMVETYQHLLEDLDVEPDRIKTDYFPGYG
ncbi:FAD-dependent oxidoreductase [Candidatus Saccharibacteria bacterium]|nr:FAD-dependent oxidoreductase [Candidatus Saccharibacteria bacterium]